MSSYDLPDLYQAMKLLDDDGLRELCLRLNVANTDLAELDYSNDLPLNGTFAGRVLALIDYCRLHGAIDTLVDTLKKHYPFLFKPDTSNQSTAGSPSAINKIARDQYNAQRDQIIGGEATHTGSGDINITHNLGASFEVKGLANPFLGLKSFSFDDQDLFSGRNARIKDALQYLTLQARPILFVIGASGCGKSSFVQAGLVPRLETFYIRAGREVRRFVFTPGSQPMLTLAAALVEMGIAEGLPITTAQEINHPSDFYQMLREKSGGGKRVNLIVIDQFEELFTQGVDAQQSTFLSLLNTLPPFTQTYTHFIITLRADYMGRLRNWPQLNDAARDYIDLPQMTKEQLEEVILHAIEVRHKDRSRKLIQPTLLKWVARDAAIDPTYLPLLQVTLRSLWDEGTMTVDYYGNLTTAIEDHAEHIYTHTAEGGKRPESELKIIDELLLSLVRVLSPTEAQADSRQGRRWEQLIRKNPDGIGQIINELVDARLLSALPPTSSEEVTVSIIHEKLIDSWPRLKAMIKEHRQELWWRTRFEQELGNWLADNKDPKHLLTGARLEEAKMLAQNDDVALYGAEAKGFLQHSLDAERRIQTHPIKRIRRSKRDEEPQPSAASERGRTAEENTPSGEHDGGIPVNNSDKSDNLVVLPDPSVNATSAGSNVPENEEQIPARKGGYEVLARSDELASIPDLPYAGNPALSLALSDQLSDISRQLASAKSRRDWESVRMRWETALALLEEEGQLISLMPRRITEAYQEAMQLQEAESKMQEATDLMHLGSFVAAIEKLRKARYLDPGNSNIREFLDRVQTYQNELYAISCVAQGQNPSDPMLIRTEGYIPPPIYIAHSGRGTSKDDIMSAYSRALYLHSDTIAPYSDEISMLIDLFAANLPTWNKIYSQKEKWLYNYQQLGNLYIVTGLLDEEAKGNWGVVARVRCLQPCGGYDETALKIMRVEHLDNPRVYSYFADEAEILQSLVGSGYAPILISQGFLHPSVDSFAVDINQVDRPEQLRAEMGMKGWRPYIAMSIMPYQYSLLYMLEKANEMAQHTPMPIGTGLDIVINALRIIQYCHDKLGYTYKDHKLEQVIWHNGKVSFIDWNGAEKLPSNEGVARSTMIKSDIRNFAAYVAYPVFTGCYLDGSIISRNEGFGSTKPTWLVENEMVKFHKAEAYLDERLRRIISRALIEDPGHPKAFSSAKEMIIELVSYRTQLA